MSGIDLLFIYRGAFFIDDGAGKLRTGLKERTAECRNFYCYIDDFYSGNAEEIKRSALFGEMQRYIERHVSLNVNEMFDDALRTTRIEMTESEKSQFAAQYVKTLKMLIELNGDLNLEFKKGS